MRWCFIYLFYLYLADVKSAAEIVESDLDLPAGGEVADESVDVALVRCRGVSSSCGVLIIV